MVGYQLVVSDGNVGKHTFPERGALRTWYIVERAAHEEFPEYFPPNPYYRYGQAEDAK